MLVETSDYAELVKIKSIRPSSLEIAALPDRLCLGETEW